MYWKQKELEGIRTWYFQLSSKLCHMQGREQPRTTLISKKQKTKKPPHLETSKALLSNGAHFRCPSFQKAVFGPLRVNIFENRSDDTEQAHVTAVNTSASYCSKACKGRSKKWWRIEHAAARDVKLLQTTAWPGVINTSDKFTKWTILITKLLYRNNENMFSTQSNVAEDTTGKLSLFPKQAKNQYRGIQLIALPPSGREQQNQTITNQNIIHH